MKQYSCPICDRPMKGQHYCSFCRQFVKNAYERKANYYLNERHPSSELNCTYHNGTEQHTGEKKSSQANERPWANRQPKIESREQGSYQPQPRKITQEEHRLKTEQQIQAEFQKPIGPFRLNLPEKSIKANTGASVVGWLIIGIVFILNFFTSCNN